VRQHGDLVVRWTVGDVSREGFEALRLSTHGARRIFGAEATYMVCVNTVPLDRARALTGRVPAEVQWLDATGSLSGLIDDHTDASRAEGVCWKFAPARLAPDRPELHLDNDCILWGLPTAIGQWLEEDGDSRCLLAEDVVTMLGQFQALCGPEPRNSGMRGVPAGFDLEAAFAEILRETGFTLRSELDEQGLVTLACSRHAPPYVVAVDEVAICGPFPPHRQALGRCGAHFVGLNAKRLPWSYDGRPGESYVREHWQRLRPRLYAALDLEAEPASP
jgi:hypothetical protein